MAFIRNNKIEMTPFVKWAGGKRSVFNSILKRIEDNYNIKELDTYIEPFVGGGGMFFSLMSIYDFEKKVIIDINKELINTYNTIKFERDELIKQLLSIEKEYNNLKSLEKQKKYYLSNRNKFNENIINNKSNIEQATLFIFLNKAGFNGLYRVNKKGLYNVPFGQRKKISLFSEKNIINVSNILKDTTIIHGDFIKSSKYIDDRTLIYMDPPYRPLPDTPSFTSYSSSEFNEIEQKRLSEFINKIKKEAKVILSNSDPTQIDSTDLFFHNLYKDFNIEKITASRRVAAKASSRKDITELLIYND